MTEYTGNLTARELAQENKINYLVNRTNLLEATLYDLIRHLKIEHIPTQVTTIPGHFKKMTKTK